MILQDEQEMNDNAVVTCDKVQCRHSTAEARKFTEDYRKPITRPRLGGVRHKYH
jgi:hypothetical protein